jgi:hypothetical protein
MTPEQIAEDWYGRCHADGPWCSIHETYWQMPAVGRCPSMDGYVGMVEQAMDDCLMQIRQEVESLRTSRSATLDPRVAGFWNGWDSALTSTLGRLRGQT